MDNFEYATRNKIRFASVRGELNVEMLWDVPLRAKDDFNLDAIAKVCSKALREATEESFVATSRTPASVRLEMALAIVKHVIAVKEADEATAKKRVENKAEKDKLLAILAEKQDGKLSKLSEKDLKERIAQLDSMN